MRETSSILVQQDYLMSVQPWISAQMVALRDHFVPLAKVAKVCVVFLCVKPVTTAAVEAARTEWSDRWRADETGPGGGGLA